MIKKVNVKPVDILDFEFPDGEVRSAKFTSYAIMTLDTEFGGFRKVFKDSKAKPFETVAKLLYAGMKACDDTVTHEQVREMVSDFDIGTLYSVLEFMQTTISDSIATENVPVGAIDNRKNRRASQRKKV